MQRFRQPLRVVCFALVLAVGAAAQRATFPRNRVAMWPVEQPDHPLAALAAWEPAPRQSLPTKPRIAATSGPGQLAIDIRFPAANRGLGVPYGADSNPPPAVALHRDLLVARSGGRTRAGVDDAGELAGLPGYLEQISCHGGDPIVLALLLPRFSALRTLHLGTLLDDTVVASLSTATTLNDLSAGSAGLTDSGLAAVGQLPALRRLTLFGDLTRVDGRTIPLLHRLECLRLATPLDLAGNERDRRVLAEILRLPRLSELQLVLHRLPVVDAETRKLLIAPLLALPALRRLSISFGEKSGATTELAAALRSRPLTHLRLAGASWETTALCEIASMATLRELDLAHGTFENPREAVEALSEMQGLVRLGLAWTSAGAPARQALSSALPECVIEWAAQDADGQWHMVSESPTAQEQRDRAAK